MSQSAPPPTPAQISERQANIPFLLELAKALHASGTATHRLEGALEDAATRLGVVAQYFATPTSIFASFGTGTSQQTCSSLSSWSRASLRETSSTVAGTVCAGRPST